MNKITRVHTTIVLVATAIFAGCTPMENKPTSMENASRSMESDSMAMTFGNSGNIQVIENPTMMFHDIIVSQTPEGAELEGKIHVKSRADFVPGHIDIAVIDKKTGDNIGVFSTDFNQRIARHGHRNLKHANNISLRLPGIDPEAVTIYVGYHHSNLDRLSKIDCGANVAVASLADKSTTAQ